jgi:hypothetical protein
MSFLYPFALFPEGYGPLRFYDPEKEKEKMRRKELKKIRETIDKKIKKIRDERIRDLIKLGMRNPFIRFGEKIQKINDLLKEEIDFYSFKLKIIDSYNEGNNILIKLIRYYSNSNYEEEWFKINRRCIVSLYKGNEIKFHEKKRNERIVKEVFEIDTNDKAEKKLFDYFKENKIYDVKVKENLVEIYKITHDF